MKKTLVLFVIPLLAFAGTVTKTMTFDSRSLSFSKANGFDVVQLRDCPTTLELGKPMLPEAVCNIVVPAGATVTDVTVKAAGPVEIPGNWRIHPVQEPVMLSSRTARPFVGPDAATYSSAQPYPAQSLVWDGYTGNKSGYAICGFALHPLSYVPATGKLTLSTSMTVTVTYRDNDQPPHAFTQSQIDVLGQDVRRIVANPEDVARFAPPVRDVDGMDCDYAIITSSALVGNWTSLVDWRTKKGWYTRVFSVDTIAAQYSGRDRQEKIRNFIIDYFWNHGLKFVLLAGDNATIPCRRCSVAVSGSTGKIPADAYYGDLQWSWDGNHNNIFGEMSGDTVDLYYDVLIGRASVDNSTQAATFISKVLLYEKNPTTDYLKKMLLPYVLLFPDQSYSGRVVSDSIANHTPAGWTDTYLNEPSSTGPVRDSINAGYNFVHGAAHGDDYGWYQYYGTAIYNTTAANSQTNATRPCVVNSMACISGNFEANECLAEAMMNNANGGAVAAMMNSREGWGTPPSMGPSERMDFQFYKFLFDQDSAELGAAFCHGKDFFANSARTQDVWRWCFYDLNLFGDPDMALWTDVPATLAVANADTIYTGAQGFQVTVTKDGSPLYYALVCCYKPGEFHDIARTAWNGTTTITVNPTTAGTMYLTVTAPGCLPVEKTVVVQTGTAQPYLVIQGYTIDDGGNGQLDPGEAANVYVTLKNLGAAAATGVAGTLRTTSSYVTVDDSASNYGTLNIGDTARGDAYHVSADAGTPPGTAINFTVHVTSSEGSWDPTFSVNIGVPPVPGQLTMDHDTGYCKLTVTSVGAIGYTDPPALDVGNGFCYPKTGGSQLFFSSFMLGNSPSYLVDHYYGSPAASAPPNSDFAIVESLRPFVPPTGDQHFRCVMSDAGHSTPKDIRVTMNSHQVAATGYDDFVVLRYTIANTGASSVSGLYAGIITDFDITPYDSNTVTSNEAKRYVYMRGAGNANPCVGIKILAPTSFANLTAVDNELYVYPDSAMTDGMKYRILDGTISLRNSNRTFDWSDGVSVGPFDLGPGESYYCAFAFIGGTSASDFDVNADSAQSWFDHFVGVKDETGVSDARATVGLTCVPNPFKHAVLVSFDVPQAGRVRAQVFDVSGRNVATLVDGELVSGRTQATWTAGDLASGIYLLKVTQPSGEVTSKLMLLR